MEMLLRKALTVAMVIGLILMCAGWRVSGPRGRGPTAARGARVASAPASAPVPAAP